MLLMDDEMLRQIHKSSINTQSTGDGDGTPNVKLTPMSCCSNIVGNQLCGDLGQLGTPVGTVGQNNPSATRLVPSPGTLPACSGTLHLLCPHSFSPIQNLHAAVWDRSWGGALPRLFCP